MATYTGYLKKNFNKLDKEYFFLGGFNKDGKIGLETYIKDVEYDVILMFRK